jgi:hypothetical protein
MSYYDSADQRKIADALVELLSSSNRHKFWTDLDHGRLVAIQYHTAIANAKATRQIQELSREENARHLCQLRKEASNGMGF